MTTDKKEFINLWDNFLCEKVDPKTTNPRRSSFSSDWWEGRFIIQDPRELWELVEILSALKPQCGLEIGTACGGTALVWQLFTPLVVSVSAVPREESEGILTDNMFPNCKFITGDSHSQETLEKVKEFAPYDYLFIDGDHSTEGCRMDYDMYARLVKAGGVVAFHDWNYHHVKAAIESINVPKQIIEYSHFGIAVIRK